MVESLEEFGDIPIFQYLKSDALKTLLEESSERELDKGEKLLEEGQLVSKSLYVVLEGTVSITKFMRREDREVTVMQPGDFLGEFGMITGEDRMANAVTKTDAVVLEVPRRALDQLGKNHPGALASFYENIIKELAGRFRHLASKAEKTQFWL